MSKEKKPYTEASTKDYYYCKSCEIDNSGKRMCPCPRGGCEAERVGVFKITKELIIFPKYNERKV